VEDDAVREGMRCHPVGRGGGGGLLRRRRVLRATLSATIVVLSSPLLLGRPKRGERSSEGAGGVRNQNRSVQLPDCS
jgi:hypothetical protein